MLSVMGLFSRIKEDTGRCDQNHLRREIRTSPASIELPNKDLVLIVFFFGLQYNHREKKNIKQDNNTQGKFRDHANYNLSTESILPPVRERGRERENLSDALGLCSH